MVFADEPAVYTISSKSDLELCNAGKNEDLPWPLDPIPWPEPAQPGQFSSFLKTMQISHMVM